MNTETLAVTTTPAVFLAGAGRPTAADDDPRFGAALDAALDPGDPPPNATKDSPGESFNPHEPAAEEGEASTEPAEHDDELQDEAGNELLSTVLVVETIILETSPAAELPEVAATSIDIDAAIEPAALPPALPVAPPPPVAAAASPEGAASPLSIAAPTTGAVKPLATPSRPAPGIDSEGPPPEAPFAEVIAEAITVAGGSDPAHEPSEAAPPSGALVGGPTPAGLPDVATDEPQAVAAGASPAPIPLAESDELAAEVAGEVPASQPDQLAPGPDPLATSSDGPIAPPVNTESAAAPASSPDNRVSTQGGADRGQAAPGGETPRAAPSVDPGRFVSRVSRAFEFASQRGGGPVEIRLSPPELGSMQVQIELREGVMTAKLEVETPAARNALLDNLPALRDRLEQQQVRIEKFDVEVRDERHQGGDWREQQDRQQSGDRRRDDSRPEAARAPADRRSGAPVGPAQRTSLMVSSSGINVVA